MAKKDWEAYFTSLKKQDWEPAKNALLRLSKEEKHNPQIYLKIGDIYQRTGDSANAIASYLMAGRILEFQGFSQKALAAFKIILRLDPNHREVIARAQKIMDDLEAAKNIRVRPAGVITEPAVPTAPAETAPVSETPAPPEPMPEQAPAPHAVFPGPAIKPPSEAPSQPSSWLESTSLTEAAPEPAEEPGIPSPQEGQSPEEFSIPESPDEAGEEEWLKTAYDAIDKSVHEKAAPGADRQEDADREKGITLRLPEERPDRGSGEIPAEAPSEMTDLMRPLSDRPGIPSKPEIFSDLSDEVYSGFIRELDTRDFKNGQTVIEEGDAGDTMYLVRSGKARVLAHLLGREIELAILGEGDLFGEVGYLTGRPRTASVIADGSLEVYEIGRIHIEALIDMNPEILARLEEFYEGRIIDTIKKIKS